MIEVKLEPCPFCGGGAHVFPSNYADVTLWNARCTKCYAAHDGHKKPKDAVAKWNTRVPHPSHAAVEAMAEALEEATQSLETIERLAGKKEEGLACFVDVRGYAHSRATVARKSLAAYRATQNKDVRP